LTRKASCVKWQPQKHVKRRRGACEILHTANPGRIRYMNKLLEIVPTKGKSRAFYKDSLFVMMLVVLFLLPLYIGGGPPDDEQLFTFGISTKHALLSWMDMHYHFWTNQLGLGIPQPFNNCLSHHPLSPLFLLDDLFIPVSVFYTVHFYIGAFFMYALCNRFNVDRKVSFLCVFTFLFSSPSVNYVHSEFLFTLAIGWTLLPVILFLFIVLLDSNNVKQSLFISILLGLLGGILVINDHIGCAFVLMFGIVVFAAFCIKDVVAKYKYIIIALVIALLFSADKIYVTYSEMKLFDQALTRNPQYQTIDVIFWSLLFKPFFYINVKEIISTIQDQGLSQAIMDVRQKFVITNSNMRNAFLGLPFVLLSFYPLLTKKYFPRQYAFGGAMIVCLVLMFLPSSTVTKVPSANYFYREPYMIFAILLAGVALTRLKEKRDGMVAKNIRLIAVAQVTLLMVGVMTSLYSTLVTENQGDSDKFHKSYLGYARDMRLVDYLKSVNVGKEDRIYLSPGSMPLAPDRVISTPKQIWDTERFYGMGLALKGFTVVTGRFKPISTNVLSPDFSLMVGGIEGQADVLINKELLDVLSIRYILATPDEARASDLVEVGRYTPYDGLEIQILKNDDAWPLAVTVDAAAINLELSRRNTCEHNKLFCCDFSAVKRILISDNEIEVNHEHGGVINLKTVPRSYERTVLLSLMYRPGWVAKTKSRNLSVFRAVENLIAIKLPPNISEVTVSYQPVDRVVLFHLFWVNLASSLIVLCVLYAGYRKNL